MNDVIATLRAALAGRYDIQRELGGGGMSRMFLATETALGRDVVVKVISPDVMGDAGADRFAREVKLAARLQHANIVPVLTAGDANGLAYYTMPMVRGETVRERLQRGAVPPAESRAILRDVARALAYAHGEGIVHRDIKPENVLLSGDAALVTDFGIAKAIALSKTEAPGGSLTRVGTSLGTPGYMAPEQAVGDEVDARADLYAWGVMAYELLTSTHPFADKTTGQQLIAAHIAEKPKALLDVVTADARRDVNVRALAPLVMQCLEKQPSARPANARDLTDVNRPVGNGVISTDRRTLLIRNRRGIWALPVSGGVLRQELRFDDPLHPYALNALNIALHAGRLYFTLQNPQSNIWVAPVTGLAK